MLSVSLPPKERGISYRTKMTASAKIETSAHGPLIVSGDARLLSRAEEDALNILLARAGGFEGDVQLYRLGWAMEDNHCTFNRDLGEYVYNPEKKTPICFHASQASYHLLSWEPPMPEEYRGQFVGEDTSKGTYNCILHFVDPVTQQPIAPTASLCERIIPSILEMHQIAFAARKGFNATRDQLRQKRIDSVKEGEKKQQKSYEAYAEAVLEDSAPAFEGNPFSFPGEKGRSASERKHEPRIMLTDGDAPASKPLEPVSQPSNFSFSSKSRVPKER